MIEPFVLRALAATLALAVITAPLGCLVLWQRMAYFGETIAQACLIGVALGLWLHVDLTVSAALAALAVAGLSFLLSRQRETPLDSVLGLLHNAALAAGLVAVSLTKGSPVDLLGYLFGDVFAVTWGDVVRLGVQSAVGLGILAWMWSGLVRIAVHEDLAAAEGVPVGRYRAGLTLLLAFIVAASIKVVGILLVISFLIVPAVAARPLARSPFGMAALAAAVGVVGSAGGIGVSLLTDAPGGAAIVLVLSVLAGCGLALSSWRNAG